MTKGELLAESNHEAKSEDRLRSGDVGREHSVKCVWYVTMAFPVPSEAFASVEIAELRRQGIDLSVCTIRTKRSDHEQVTEQQQVESIPAKHADWMSPVRGLIRAAMQPTLAFRLWWRLIRDLASRPIELLACLFWSLRCFELMEEVRRAKPNMVHLYWGHVPSMLGWLLAESQPDQAFTIGLSAYDLEMALPMSFQIAKNGALGVRSWASANNAAICSRGVEASRVKVVHQGVSLSKFSRDLEGGKSTVSKRLLFAGRLIPEKGVELTLELTRKLRTRYPDIELVIVGSGPLQEVLSRRIQEWKLEGSVFLLGHLSHSEFAEELAKASIFLLPSSHAAERLPNVVKEAAAAGCCCLTTNTPGIEKLIRDGESGRILPANNVDTWVDAVTGLMEEPRRLIEMAEEAKRLVHKHFDVELTAAELIRWWQKLLTPSNIEGAS